MADTKLEKTVLLANAALEKLQSLEAVAAEDATWVKARAAPARAEAADTGVDEAKIALTKVESEAADRTYDAMARAYDATSFERGIWVAARTALAKAEAAGTGVDEARIALTKFEEEKCAQLEAEIRSACGDFEHGDGGFGPVQEATNDAKIWFELAVARAALAIAQAAEAGVDARLVGSGLPLHLELASAKAAGVGVDEARIVLAKVEAEMETYQGAKEAVEWISSLGVSKNKDGTYNITKPDRDAAHVWFELPIARSALARAQARVAYETEAAGIKIDKTNIK